MKEVICELEHMKWRRWKGVKILKGITSEKGKEKLMHNKKHHKQLCEAIKVLKEYEKSK